MTSTSSLLFLIVTLVGAASGSSDCEGVECLLQVMHFAAFRLGVDTLDVNDEVKGRFAVTKGLKEALFEAELEAMEAVHEAEMETAKLRLEILEAEVGEKRRDEEPNIVRRITI